MFSFSNRAVFFIGDSQPIRKLHHPRIARYSASIRLRNQANHQIGPLTLASLGFESNPEKTKEDRTNGVGDSSLGMRVSPSKEANLEKTKKDRTHGVDDSSLGMRVSPSKEKPARSVKSKARGVRNVLPIEDAPFAAKTFSELSLSPLVIERLEKEGLTGPTDVQSTAIPTILKNHGVVIQSYTGSGKTLAYLLPILSQVGPLKKPSDEDELGQKPVIEAVIVAPSRELGMQIVREVERLFGPTNKRLVQQLVGGANRSRQEEALKKNKPVIVVGTPGRIAEISAAGRLHTHGCRFLVLDEVDQLLAFNFREDMHRILEHVGRRSGADRIAANGALTRRAECQTIMVSATVPFSVMRAARSWVQDPLLVRSKTVVPLESVPASEPVLSPAAASSLSSSSVTQGAIESLPPSLKHYYCVTKLQHKVDSLRRCVHALDAKSVIAFMNHTKRLKDAVFKLKARGMKAAELHGGLGKLARSTTLKNFKDGEVRVLVTNELSARGLDVAECDLVVNLDLPTDSIHYAHRAGRTGRLGRKGSVVTICEEPEVFVVKKFQRQLSIAIEACEFAEGKLVFCKEEEKNAAAVR
ncbi:hypothetical protein ACLOJK_017097 [Asimina triloba]